MPRYSHPDDLGKRLGELERRLQNLETSPRLSGATLHVGEGALKIVNSQGVTIGYFGLLSTGDVGILFKRSDGSTSFAQYTGNPNGVGSGQFWAWYDESGNIVFSDDVDSNQGLARPYIEIGPWANLNLGQVNSATSTSWTDMYTTTFPKQHPKLSMQALVYADSSTTGGEVRVMLDGSQIGTTKSVASNTYTYQRWDDLVIPGAHMSEHSLTLQARLTGGSGNVRCQPVMAYGKQS